MRVDFWINPVTWKSWGSQTDHRASEQHPTKRGFSELIVFTRGGGPWSDCPLCTVTGVKQTDSGFRLWVVTAHPIQHETQTEHWCGAAKGLRDDPVPQCFNLHFLCLCYMTNINLHSHNSKWTQNTKHTTMNITYITYYYFNSNVIMFILKKYFKWCN